MKDVIKERRALNPSATVCYFNLIDKPDKGIGAFDLEARPLIASNRPTQTSAQLLKANESRSSEPNVVKSCWGVGLAKVVGFTVGVAVGL